MIVYVVKWMDGTNRHICGCDSGEEAKKIVEYLKSNDWSEENIMEVQGERKPKKYKYLFFYNEIVKL